MELRLQVGLSSFLIANANLKVQIWKCKVQTAKCKLQIQNSQPIGKPGRRTKILEIVQNVYFVLGSYIVFKLYFVHELYFYIQNTFYIQFNLIRDRRDQEKKDIFLYIIVGKNFFNIFNLYLDGIQCRVYNVRYLNIVNFVRGFDL